MGESVSQIAGRRLEFVEEILNEAAQSIANSFDCYWPADEVGRNDAAEANVALHMAHSLLSRTWTVYAEANHPEPSIQGIDLLAIAPKYEWYLAVEFKRFFSKQADSIAWDLQRLHTFRLNTRLNPDRVGARIVGGICGCQEGIGVVAGLNWETTRASVFRQVWEDHRSSNSVLGRALTALNAHCFTPVLATNRQSDHPRRGHYYLYAAAIRIPVTSDSP